METWIFQILEIWDIGDTRYWRYKISEIQNIGDTRYWSCEILENLDIGDAILDILDIGDTRYWRSAWKKRISISIISWFKYHFHKIFVQFVSFRLWFWDQTCLSPSFMWDVIHTGHVCHLGHVGHRPSSRISIFR